MNLKSPDVAVPTSESSGGSSAASDSFTVDADGFEVRTEVTVERGWTYVSHQIRNTERTDKEAIIFHIEYDAPVADSLELLRSLSPHEVDTEGYARFSIGSLGYLEEEKLLYSIPGTYSLADIQESRIAIEAESLHDAESLAAIEEQQTQTAREAVKTNISETIVDNKTVIRMGIDLQDNVTEVYGVEIEQEIPKCLITEITESVLEAAIDPALLEHVSIKEADPLLVWRFDRLEDAVNLELTLDALRSADCDDEVTLELLARSYIYQNQPINWLSVMWVLVLSGSVVLLVLSPIFLASRHRFHRHESPHVLRLAKTIVRDSHRGVSNVHIKRNLLANDESKVDVKAAFSHVAETNISHLGLAWFEHRVEIALFFSVLALSLMELSGLLPGYLDWFKKVLSWVLMLLVVHHANLSRLFFNEDAPRFSLCLMLGMFFMHLVWSAPTFRTRAMRRWLGRIMLVGLWFAGVLGAVSP
ncbi:hypothetical protein H5P28_06270 [Ruficoccus amylovorans]|uniref:Uncharacterized protein n=1 Tax=Ruficoccus amylovorans TaxID=1804625 RepID=A0A842HBS1_9BACT|nr:hypothetical protein [Ruficoccus amylovorans]MBC2593862.1 hypothetical protein [Ruficoccus amylovorans]